MISGFSRIRGDSSGLSKALTEMLFELLTAPHGIVCDQILTAPPNKQIVIKIVLNIMFYLRFAQIDIKIRAFGIEAYFAESHGSVLFFLII